MMTFASAHPYASRLIQVGEMEVSPSEYEKAAIFFDPDFQFHGPGNFSTDYDGLSAYFASLRHAFENLQIERAIVFGEDTYLAARTVFSGRFTRTFTMSPVGPIEPNGKLIRWEVMNIFRYNDAGLLAEEWVQSDANGLVHQLHASAATQA
jgi:predicted ester cyclase